MRSTWSLVVLLLVASACERRITVYVDEATPNGVASGPGGAGGAGGAGGVAGAGGGGAGGAGASGGSGGSAGGSNGGGGSVGASGAGGAASGNADAGPDGGGALDAGRNCTVDTDCPPPSHTCALSRCASGSCVFVDAPLGSRIPDVPADCHAALCDGHGNVVSLAVDVINVPLSDQPCQAAGCTAFGDTVMKPLGAGTVCHVGARQGTCDGAGSCVECNRTADCPPGLFCDAHHFCGSAPCTDVDCGGACGPCGLGKRCVADSDCQSFACDAATTTCIQDQCSDHRQDGDETDADCGGTCQGCAFGQACLLDDDCKYQACDTLTLRCISNQCADHRQDGQETGIDCGGGACAACTTGGGCNSNLDCQSGHVCLGSKVCS
jgi:hypothetical protein